MEHRRPVKAVAFSPAGRWLMTAGADNAARMWRGRPEDLIAEACPCLPRNLTHEEWRQYIGSDIPYRLTCPNLPVPEE